MERGEADYNHPDAIDWSATMTAVNNAALTTTSGVVNDNDRQRQAGPSSSSSNSSSSNCVLIDSHLLLGEHPTANALRERCNHFILLDLPADKKQSELIHRKWSRPRHHLGDASYKDKGVELAEYTAFWEQYVWPRWVEHGLSRSFDPGVVDPSRMTRLDCTESVATNLERAMSSCVFAT